MLKPGLQSSRESPGSMSNILVKPLQSVVIARASAFAQKDPSTQTHTHGRHTHIRVSWLRDKSALSEKLARKKNPFQTLLFQDLSTHQRTDLLCILHTWMTVRRTSVPHFSAWIHTSAPAALAIGHGPPANSAALQRQITEPSWAHNIHAFPPPPPHFFSILSSISPTVCDFCT